MGKAWTIRTSCQQKAEPAICENRLGFTLGDTLLGAPDLIGLVSEELVTLLANVDDLLAGDAKVLDGSEDLLGDLSGSLVLGQGVGVVERIICKEGSVVGQRGGCCLT